MSLVPFSSLNLKADLLDNLATLGYRAMTPIQSQSLPPVLAGQDVIAQAKTGSGKTAAFGLGLLQHLEVKRYRVQSLVLCPTRELADQVAKELRKLARKIHNIKILTLCGGMPLGPQLASLEHGAHIVVGTPGRVEEHLRKNRLELTALTTLVLDEADRMLDMGFQAALDAIIEKMPRQRQTLLFSATYPEEIQSIARRVMIEPVIVKVEESHSNASIEQVYYALEKGESLDTALRLLLLEHQPESTLVFCNTRREASEVCEQLRASGFSALALHGELDQKQREQILVRFANKSSSILVATDVAARGLDIDALDAVINYHIARDVEVHVHRIGRTGRAGSKGLACTLFSEKERYKLERLEQFLQQDLPIKPLPSPRVLERPPHAAPMHTLQINGGKKQKLRAGDILGALTGDRVVAGNQVGKIDIFDNCAYVAVHRSVAKAAEQKLARGKLKGRSFKVRLIRG